MYFQWKDIRIELHSVKEKESKSELTGGWSLNGQIKWWIQMCKKCLQQVEESFVHDATLLRHYTAFEIFYCLFD